jgi:hypothetical protein
MDVWRMSLFEFACVRAGYADANQTEERAPVMSDDTAADLGIEGF